ncbi:MAG: sugar ABC transporter permease [Cyanobacteriota bacterium]|nr:sugar ABC transporter permease [Cyanobacteriota bacterium]
MFLISSFWPILQAICLSFTNYDILNVPRWVGLKNYVQLIGDPLFWKALVNTLFYLACVVPFLVILPLGLAILVNQSLPGIRWFRVIYYLPVIFSVVIAGLAWKWIYAENGLLNYVLSSLLFHPIQINWLTDPRFALPALATVTIWKGLGYYMVIYLSGLQGIPQHLYEAAAMDGANPWQQHTKITLPLMASYMILVMILSAIAAMKVFEEVYVMTRGGPANSTLTLVYYLYEQGISRLNMGYAAAMGAVLFAITLCLSLIGVKLLNSRGING